MKNILDLCKGRLPDFITGFTVGMILATGIILWDSSSLIQRMILVVINILSLSATARTSWSEKNPNDGNNSSDDSTSIIPVDGKHDSSNMDFSRYWKLI